MVPESILTLTLYNPCEVATANTAGYPVSIILLIISLSQTFWDT